MLPRAADQAVFFVHRDRRQRRGAGQRVAVVGQPAVEDACRRKWSAICRRMPTAPSGTYALVSPLAIVMRSGTTPQWSTANHSPVRPKPDITSSAIMQDAVLVAQRAHALQVAVRRNQDAVGAGDRLEDEAGNGVRAFELDHFFEQRSASSTVSQPRCDAVIRVGHVHDARACRLGGPAPRIAGERDRAGGRAVIRAVPREDLLAAGVPARAILMAFSLASAPPLVKKKPSMSPGVIAASFAPSRARGSVAMKGLAYGKLSRLFLDRLHDARVAVADVHAHQLAVEVEEALAFRRPEIHALGAVHGDRVDGALRGPLEDGVLLGQRDDLVACHGPGAWLVGMITAAAGRPSRRCHSAVDSLRALRLMKAPAPARPTNRPLSMTTRPREMTVSVTPVTSRPSYGL